ncbi:MAG: zinc-ribbon domain containing protein [Ardenticatenales bacterium]|nr:zinc-ribbon domain containing protein [Ardenticatenales bacterium]
MAERTLTCRDCGNSFVFTEGEQEFFTMKGFSEPSRCPDCRAAHKRQRQGRDNREMSSPPRDRGTQESRGDRQLYEVECSECGTLTQVPFKPRGHSPVYCRTCFNNRR